MIAGTDMVLQVTDLDAAVAFYERKMELKVVSREAMLVGLDAGTFRLYLEPGPALGPVLEFFAEDMAAERIRLVEAGCTLIDDDPSVPRCYLRDPYGMVFNLAQRSK